RAIAVQEIAPALERQLSELEAQRRVSKDEAGIAPRPPEGDFFKWGLHARMDTILKEVGYSQGGVGERMKALAKDPRYKFSQGDKGRAEIMAFINERLRWIR